MACIFVNKGAETSKAMAIAIAVEAAVKLFQSVNMTKEEAVAYIEAGTLDGCYLNKARLMPNIVSAWSMVALFACRGGPWRMDLPPIVVAVVS